MRRTYSVTMVYDVTLSKVVKVRARTPKEARERAADKVLCGKAGHPDPASLDKRERANAKRREAKRQAEFYRVGCARTNWRLHGAFSAGAFPLHRAPGPVMLRVSGEQIETSQGARIPLAAAPMVWNMVQERMKTPDSMIDPHGARYDSVVARYFRRARVGDYVIDGIDADGTLHAGCHTIPYGELEVMARQLGLQ